MPVPGPPDGATTCKRPLVSHIKIRARAAALATVFTLGLAGSGPSRAAGPDITNFKLTNGLEVVVIPDHRTPVVTHMVWYRVGAADETPGKTGLAHFLE